MKTTNRFVLALLSSLLLSAGFVRAAERLDPISQATSHSNAKLTPAPECGSAICNVVDDVL